MEWEELQSSANTRPGSRRPASRQRASAERGRSFKVCGVNGGGLQMSEGGGDITGETQGGGRERGPSDMSRPCLPWPGGGVGGFQPETHSGSGFKSLSLDPGG